MGREMQLDAAASRAKVATRVSRCFSDRAGRIDGGKRDTACHVPRVARRLAALRTRRSANDVGDGVHPVGSGQIMSR